MKRKIKMSALVTLILFMVSCATYPGLDSRLLEDLVDITKYDVNTNFTQFKTFSIVDSVTVIKNGTDSSRVLNPQAQALLTQIIANMQARGYAKVDRKTGNPDLGINVSAVKVTNLVYYYPGWYWDYYGYYDPMYWGYPGDNYWYPYYPPDVSSYTSGTVIIDMLDLKNAVIHGNKLYVVWNAYIRGLMTGYHTLQDVLDNVDQCFAQTPQIRTNLLSP
jgi:hypothetical protein